MHFFAYGMIIASFNIMRMHLAKLLVRGALVNLEQIREAMELQRDSGYELGEALVNLGYITEPQLIEFLGNEYGVPVMDIDDCDIEESVVNLIPKDIALEKFLVPIRVEGTDLTIALSDPSNILLLDDLGFITGKNIKPVVSSERSIKNKLSKYYGERESAGALPDDEVSGESGNTDRTNEVYLFSDKKSSPIDDVIKEIDQYKRDQSSVNNFTGSEEELLNAGLDSGSVDFYVEPVKSEVIKENREGVNKPDDKFVFDFTDASDGGSGSPAPDSGAGFSMSGDGSRAGSAHDEVLGMRAGAEESYSQDENGGISGKEIKRDDDSGNDRAENSSSQAENFFSQIKNDIESESPDFTEESDTGADGGGGIGFTPPPENGVISHKEFSPETSAAEEAVHAESEDRLDGYEEDGVEGQGGCSHEPEADENDRSPAVEFVEDREINSNNEDNAGNAVNYSSAREHNSSNSTESRGTEEGLGGGHTVSGEEPSEIAPIMNSAKSVEPETKGDDARRSILIVDVSPTVQKIMRITLERAGYRVSAAGDGMQALAKINEAIPDLIFVDIKLPHMDGYQLCKVVKSHGLTKDIPVVMLSGKLGVLDKMKVKMSGASDYITKPFGADSLVEAVEKYAG